MPGFPFSATVIDWLAFGHLCQRGCAPAFNLFSDRAEDRVSIFAPP